MALARLLVWNDVLLVQSAWSYMAMGDFPYPSSYILNGNGHLPAFPVRVACKALSFNPRTVRRGAAARSRPGC